MISLEVPNMLDYVLILHTSGWIGTVVFFMHFPINFFTIRMMALRKLTEKLSTITPTRASPH